MKIQKLYRVMCEHPGCGTYHDSYLWNQKAANEFFRNVGWGVRKGLTVCPKHARLAKS